MKNYSLFFLFIIASWTAFTQEPYYTEDDWKVGETKEINGTLIKKIEGDYPGHGITNFSYLTKKQLFASIKRKKKEGEITQNRYDKDFQKINIEGAGGMLQMYITRHSQSSSNSKWFKVVITNKAGKEVYRGTFDEHDPVNTGDGDYPWINKTFHYIKPQVFLPCTIEITEQRYDGKKFVYVYEILKM